MATNWTDGGETINNNKKTYKDYILSSAVEYEQFLVTFRP